MLNFSTKSSSTSTALRRRRTRLCMPCQYYALSCLLIWVLTGRFTSSSVWNFALRPSGLQIGGNLGVLDRGCPSTIFYRFPSRETFVRACCVMLQTDFLLDSCKVEIETLSEFFFPPRSYLCVEVDYLPSIHKNSSFTVPEDSACLLSKTFLNFFPTRWRMVPLTLCLQFKAMNPCLVCCNNPE
jgi:hypothetical protein